MKQYHKLVRDQIPEIMFFKPGAIVVHGKFHQKLPRLGSKTRKQVYDLPKI